MRGFRGISGIAALAATAVLAAGCGSDDERQDADEPTGTFPVEIERAEFDTSQSLAEDETFTIAVRNAGDERIPNLAVTLTGFAERSEQEGLADPSRPLWIVDSAPQGGDTAYVSTWALGPVDGGATRTFRWDVTPIEAGTHTLEYEVAAGLDGKARAVLEGGGAPAGSVTVRVDEEPAQARVDPETGDVIRGGTGD